MPIILPPHAFDVPAIVKVAAHAPAAPTVSHLAAPAPRGKIVPGPGARPLGTGQTPEIVSPVPAVPVAPSTSPPPTTTSSSTRPR